MVHTKSVSSTNYFHSLQDNDPALLQVDIMGMTPLHILCAKPAVIKDMIKQLYNKNTEAAAVRNVSHRLSWHMYVVNKDIQFYMFNQIKDGNGRFISITMTDTARMLMSNEFDSDKLVDANLHIDTKEMYLNFNGSSLVEWLETPNALTGLYPFMSMATKSNDYNLEEVNKFAMMNLNSIESNCVVEKSTKNKATDEGTRDTKRVKLS